VITAAGIEVLKIPPRAPRANAHAERWVRTVRTECLDWILIRNRSHLHRILTAYLKHYNTARPHRAIGLVAPLPAPTTALSGTQGQCRQIRRIDILGGLVHEYVRAA